jgi:molybdate transport system regulatory protein
LGPGKADLLEQIAASGSIRKAAAKLDMSYMRAWSLVKTMNRCFREPLVESQRGGKEQGGARLTDCGRRMLELYREMEAAALQATAESWRAMREMMKK